MAVLILLLLAQSGALSWFVRKGDLEAARAMLAVGADPNKRDPFRATPLFWAVSKNHADVTVLLLDYNAEVNATSYSATPLHDAVMNNRADLVELLLDHKADINARHVDGGWTPLHFAVIRGFLPVAKLLIDRGADIRVADKSGMTALASAAARGRTEIARLLIEKGADLNTRDNEGAAPLDVAILGDAGETAAVLVEAGAEIGRRNLQTGATPLNEAAIKGLTPVAALLLARHADAAVKDNAGLAPLENAVRFHRNGVAELLLAAGVNAGTAGGSAGLLEEAVMRGYADTVELLLKHGANASARFRS